MEHISVTWGDDVVASGWVAADGPLPPELSAWLDPRLSPKDPALTVTRQPGRPSAPMPRLAPMPRDLALGLAISVVAFTIFLTAAFLAVPAGAVLSAI